MHPKIIQSRDYSKFYLFGGLILTILLALGTVAVFTQPPASPEAIAERQRFEEFAKDATHFALTEVGHVVLSSIVERPSAKAMVVETPKPQPIKVNKITPCSPFDPDRIDPEKCSAMGQPIGGTDPCAEHIQPEFTTEPKSRVVKPEWLDICRLHPTPVPDKNCLKFLEGSWAMGNDSVHPSFAVPEGCID